MGSRKDSGPTVGAHRSAASDNLTTFLVSQQEEPSPPPQCPSRPRNKSNARNAANPYTLPSRGSWGNSPSTRSASSAVCVTRCWTPRTRTATSGSYIVRPATDASSDPRVMVSGPGLPDSVWTPALISTLSKGAVAGTFSTRKLSDGTRHTK